MASAIFASVSIAGRPSAAPPSITPLERLSRSSGAGEFVGDVLDREAQFVGQRPDGGQLVGDGGVVPLHHGKDGHVLPGTAGMDVSRQSRTIPPGWASWPGVSCCSGTLTRSRRTPEVGFGLPGELLGQQVEHVEVRLGLPRRVDRRGEGVHERVHVGGGQVVLLVPGGGREHDVGQQRGGGHPEVRGDQQVQLSLRRLLVPFHVLGLEPFGVVLGPGHCCGCPAGSGGSTRCPWPRSRTGWSATAPGSAASSPGRPRPRSPGSGCGSSARPRCSRGCPSRCRRRRRPPPRRRGPAGCGRTAGRTASSRAGPTGPARPRCACRPGPRWTAGTSARPRE